MGTCRFRILVVEDEEILAANLRDFLARRYAAVCTAASAEVAVEQARQFGPTHVVLDYSLPGVNGLEAFSLLRAHFPELRGVLISGHPTDQLRAMAGAAGIEYILTKPFALSDLERVLRAWQPGDFDRRPATAPDFRDRRHALGEPRFPLAMAGGWILQDRRVHSRTAAGSPPTALSALDFASG